MLFSRLVPLTSCIAGISVLRRVRRWWLMFFLNHLGDVASVDVDTVGVVVGASLASCIFSMIAVKSCSAFACLSFAFVVCGTSDLISVRISDAAMRVLSDSKIVVIFQCSGYILAELDMRILWVDGTQYFLLR